MNPKLQKVVRDIERAKTKIEELQALLPDLERQKTELENAEIIKVFRSADVAPGDFAKFIAAYQAQLQDGAPGTTAKTAVETPPSSYPGVMPRQSEMEDSDDE